MHKKQAKVGLVIASIMSLNTLPSIAILNTGESSTIIKNDYSSETTNPTVENNDNLLNKEQEYNNMTDESSNNTIEENSNDLNVEEDNISNTETNDNLTSEDETVEDETDDNLTSQKEIIKFKDKNIINIINKYLNKNDLMSPIYKDEVLDIKELDFSNSNISDLTGIEYIKNLEVLNISENNIVDISNLATLSQLKEIKAYNNNIYDISVLNDLNVVTADFSNQKIYMLDITTKNIFLTISNPVKTINKDNINYNISNNGLLNENIFEWENLILNKYNLKIEFTNNKKEIQFSGAIYQNVYREEIIDSDINIDLTLEHNEWTNNNLKIYYNISKIEPHMVEQILFSTNETSLNNNGYFEVESNGVHSIKVYLKTGEIFEKSIIVSNIDKNKPDINILHQSKNNNNVKVHIEAVDKESGIKYIILPNGEKIYNNKATYSFDLNKEVIFKAVDNAGNVTEYIFKNDYINKFPIIIATDKKILLGDTFNPLEGVLAIDYDGTDITRSINIISNPVNTSELGEYLVTYSVRNSQGFESIKTITIEVIPNEIDKQEDNIVDNSQINELLGSDAEKSDESKSTESSISKNTYYTAIILSMISGFAFLFKSGKDNF